MGNRSTEKLVAALLDAGAPTKLVARAKANEFHDFYGRSATPIIDLVNACKAHGLHAVAQQAIDGAFDATREEAEAWMRGQLREGT